MAFIWLRRQIFRQLEVYRLPRRRRPLEPLQGQANGNLESHEVRDRVTGNDEGYLLPARSENQRLARTDAHLPEMHLEAEFGQRPRSKVVVPHAGAAGNEQAVPIFRRVLP